MATARTPIGTAGVPPDAIARILRPRGLAGWNVRKDQLIALDDSGTVTVPSHWSVVRDDPTTGAVKPLGVVGNRNEPIQNEQHLELVIEIAETPISTSSMRGSSTTDGSCSSRAGWRTTS